MSEPATPGNRPGEALADHLVGFVEQLRARGVPVGPSETVDAGQVLAQLDLLDRQVLREGLACALIRRPTHRPTFDGLFDLWFPAALGDRSTDPQTPDIPRTPDGSIDRFAMREMLAEMLSTDSAQLQDVVAQLVGELGRYQSATGPSFSAYQTLREISPESLLARVAAGLMTAAADGDADPTTASLRIAQRTASARIAALRESVEAETRRRAAERIGRDRVAAYGVAKQAEQVDFLRASQAELHALRRNVAALARLLATRLAARRKRTHRGSIDLRSTLRKSMSTGGVPVRLVARAPRRTRPELVILCDVSGSVAGFSNFTLLLVHALREQFSKVRIFAFVDRLDEVTAHFGPQSDLAEAMNKVFTESKVVGWDGHSDYGSALVEFAEQYRGTVHPRSSLLILGDARNNYREPQLAVLRELVAAAKHAHWLNPEPRAQWGSGDSAALAYSEAIDMRECRNAAQLAGVVAQLLPM